MWHDMYNDGHFWGMHWFWWIFWILLFVIVFLALWGYRSRLGKRESPLDILKRKYANGEMDEDEYLKRKAVLEGKEDN